MKKIVLENFDEGNDNYKINLFYLNREQVEEIKALVSKWNPTDEDIKDCIRMCLTDANEHRFKAYGTTFEDCLAWLEKQGGQRLAEEHKLLIGADYGVDGLYHAIRILEKTLGDVDGYQTDDGILEHEIAIDTVKALYEKKPNGWTKNDSQIKGAIVEYLVDNNLTEWANWLETQIKIYPCKDCDYENTNIQQNNFAPKFKLGDWIVWQDKCYKVNDNGCGYELIDTNGLSTSLEYGTVDENARLWTIADAKDGDILSAYECIVVFKEIDWLNIRCYCAYHYLNHQAFYVDTLQNKTAFHPATKEQRELLFKKMYEAGYEFDFNKKELKKTPEESLGISSEKYNEIVNECIFGEEKKSKWTKKDEGMMKSIIVDIEYARSCHDYDMDAHYNEELTWLKLLKQRMEEQQ